MTATEIVARLRAALESNGLQEHAERIIALGKPAVWVSLERTADHYIPIGRSKVGGEADLPREMPWPTRASGCLLHFIAQFDCADIRRVQPGLDQLPQSGLISFFYDTITQPAGFEPPDRDASQIVYSPPGAGLVRKATPPVDPNTMGGFDLLPSEQYRLGACKVSLAATTTWPDWGALEIGSLLNGEEVHQYGDALDELDHVRDDSEGCQLGGYPWCIQNEMREECALIHAGFDTSSEWPKGPKASQVRATADQWQLLMQIGSAWSAEDSHGIMWGDVGEVYFWCRSDSIRDRTFCNQLALMQCS